MAATEKVDFEGSAQFAEDVKTGEVFSDDLTPEEDRRLLRRIDCCLLPVMALSYLFQFLDKSALAFTAILGLREDLHLSGGEYSWSSGIYYFGYLAASYPVGVLMVRWRVGKLIAASLVAWGTVLILTSVCSNANGLLANRFFLGFTESAIAPGLSIVVSMWYKRSEQPLRQAAWFLGNTCAGIFGGLLAYGIGHVESIPAWKAIFLIFGSITIAWAVGIYFLLPDTPSTAWFLGAEDRQKAIMRVKENMTSIKSDEFKWAQLREALLDIKTWMVVVLHLASNIPNGGITTFGTIVIHGFGFSTFNTLLLQCATYLVQLVLVIVSAVASSYLPNVRTYCLAVNYAISVIGATLVRQLPAHSKWGRFAGVCLAGAYSANFPVLMSLVTGNFGGFTKKTTVNAIGFIAYCTGNIIGPQLFFPKEAPTYNSGFLAIMVCFGMGVVMAFAVRLYLGWENRRRDQLDASRDVNEALEHQIRAMVNLMDKTDKEIHQFRYVY